MVPFWLWSMEYFVAVPSVKDIGGKISSDARLYASSR